jgi:hypothetical protein
MRNRLHVFVRIRYTTFISVRIAALRSVNKIFRRATNSQLRVAKVLYNEQVISMAGLYIYKFSLIFVSG